MSSSARSRLFLSLAGGALALAFAWVVPLGEAPDELAHIRYAEALAKGRLPSVDPASDDGYEGHQPPLAYLPPALVIALRGGLALNPEHDAGFDFHRAGSRAFRVPFASERDELTLRLARSTQAIWIVLALWASFSLSADSRSAAPFLLAPQLLFAGGVLGNDAPLVALVSCALVALCRFVEKGTGEIAAAGLFTLCLFTKASGLLVLAPTLVALTSDATNSGGAVSLADRRKRLAFSTALGLLLWIAFQLLRTGAPLPRVPAAHRTAGVWEIVSDPSWFGGLFRSFWGKFGWLNTPLPAAFFFWFALLTAVALAALLRGRETRSRLLQATVAANVALLLAYQLLVERQAQGRYLLPSIAAIASAGSGALPERFRSAAAVVAVLVAVASLEVVRRAYR